MSKPVKLSPMMYGAMNRIGAADASVVPRSGGWVRTHRALEKRGILRLVVPAKGDSYAVYELTEAGIRLWRKIKEGKP